MKINIKIITIFSHCLKTKLSAKLLSAQLLLATGLLFSITAQSLEQKLVLQVDGSLSINQQVEFEKAPFVLLENEPSTLAEEGLGGYKVELTAERNQDESFTVFSKIYTYTKSGYTLLGTPSIKLEYQSLGTIEFVSEVSGPVIFQLEIVKKAEMTTDTSDFGDNVR
jgi:hypothetical protein